jgi:hypothetical protein
MPHYELTGMAALGFPRTTSQKKAIPIGNVTTDKAWSDGFDWMKRIH